jgi:aldose 1-epimerase
MRKPTWLWLGVSSIGTAFREFNSFVKTDMEKKMKIESSLFGETREGRKVTAYTVTNSSGASMTVLDFGAVLQSVIVPDRNGTLTDVALGYDRVEDYEVNPPHFGATIGRNGNRIEGASFNLNGQDYQLELNENGKNNLHSGPDGYEFRMWDAKVNEANGCVSFHILSPDGDQGFPGNFNVTVTYMLTEDNKVKIHYEGSSDADTIANMTNHSYFNLNGEGSGTIMNHTLQIDADGYTPVDEYSIPYGTVDSVAGTPFDFRRGKTIAQDADVKDEQLEHTGGYDHNFALNGSGLRNVACAIGDLSGIKMTVMTDQPGIQFYAGNFISGPVGKKGHAYGRHEGFALETQHFPNSVNVLAFDSPKLEAGETYSITTCYTFSVEQ